MADPALEAKVLGLIDALGAYRPEYFIALANPKQLAFREAFFKHEKRTFAALGGNRSGKTITTGRLCFATQIRDHARNGDLHWVVSPTSEKSVSGPQKELWNTLPHWMFGGFTFDEKNGFDGVRPIVTMVLPNDRGRCVINFKNCEQSATTFESDKLNGCWVSEKLPHEYYVRILPRLIDRRGWLLYDDIPEQEWQYSELMQAPPESSVYCVIMSMYDNEENLPTGAIQEFIDAVRVKEEIDMRVFGKFRRLSGIVFKEFHEGLIVPPFGIPSTGPYPSETNWPRWRTLDSGGSAPTAVSWWALAPNECAYKYREYYQRYGSVRAHSLAIHELSKGPDGKPEEYVGNLMDPACWNTSDANPVNVADQYALEGLPFSPWPRMNVFGERAAVEIVRRRMEVGQLKIMSHLVETLREYRSWKYQLDAEGNPKASDTYEDANNHLIDGDKGLFATRPIFTVPQIKVRG